MTNDPHFRDAHWLADAMCQKLDVHDFFPRHGRPGANRAREICAMCDVRTECQSHMEALVEEHKRIIAEADIE